MKNKRILTTVALVLALSIQSGCSINGDGAAAGSNMTAEQQKTLPVSAPKSKESIKMPEENKKGKEFEEFNELMLTQPKTVDAARLIEKNISLVSTEEATKMIIAFEELQKAYLPKLEEKFHKDVSIQEKFIKEFKPGKDLSNPDSFNDKTLKELVTEVKEGGYKVETAEGMFFPVLDYIYYKKFSTYVSSDVKAYIDIMAVESEKVPAKDAALVISWEEVLKRAVNQEAFIKKYDKSPKIKDVKELFEKYLSFMLYGANNTPLFSYETKQMVPEAKKAYTTAVENNKDSEFLKLVGGYLEVMKKSNYKLTSEVEKFRKENGDASQN